MQRFGQLLRVKPEKFEEYKAYHTRVWPEVLATIRRCHIHNYSIFHWQGLLFAYFEDHWSESFEAVQHMGYWRRHQLVDGTAVDQCKCICSDRGSNGPRWWK